MTGAGGMRSAALIARVTGTTFETGTPSATVAGNPPGISVSFNPVGYYDNPPSGLYSMDITVASAVPTGVYSITVDYSLTPEGGDCSAPCVQPTYLLFINPEGLANLVTVNLQDALNVLDSYGSPATAPLSDVVSVPDEYVAPAVATLSDVVGVVDNYVAPATAVLSDGVNVVDRYISPVESVLSDAIGLIDQVTASPPPLTAVLGLKIEAHSPVNIVVVTSGGQAGFEADGTVVNQLLANMTGPNAEPETVTIPGPSAGYYQIIVFGKPSAGANGSAYTITVASLGGDGTSLSEWSHTGIATSGSTAVLSVYLLSNGSISTSPPAAPTESWVLYVILALGAAGAAAVLVISRLTARRAGPSAA